MTARQLLDRPAQARITGPHGIGPFRWHASYTVGIGIVERGSLAWTRKGIHRKASRTLRRLQRDHDRHTNPVVITAR